MKNILVLLGFVCVWSLSAQQLAFPGAEGFGKYATGGRGGSVYHVTNLNDGGRGSFRDAVSRSNRIVVFDVAGVIRLNSGLVVSSNLYIAGQTAPGEGITVYGNRVSFSGADNTICRYMRFRMGVVGDSGKDAMGISNGKNMIFDHVSVSWGRDETFSINWDGKGTEPSNITIQNSIISHGLLLHSAGGLIQTGGGVTLYRNLYANNSTRNNKVKGVNQFVNNIVYNWKNGAYIMGGDSEGSSQANVVSNMFVKGPDKGGTPIGGGNSKFHIYADDNWYDDNLDGFQNGYLIPRNEYSGGPDFQEERYAYPVVPKLTANELIDSLLPVVGASLPYRDLSDYYVIDEVWSLGIKGELISNESSLPIGAPTTWNLWGGNNRIDTDNDGMPDDWEDANGTDKTVDDAMDVATNGYANIENYINGITELSSQPFLRMPFKLTAKSFTESTITFSWMDYTRDEEGFIIERDIEGTFTEVGRVGQNVSAFVLGGLEPEEQGTFRIYAFKGDLISEYATITAKSRPEEVPVIDLDTYEPDVIWNGNSSNIWDTSTTNWFNSSTIVTTYSDGDSVLFGNTMSNGETVSLSGELMPAAIVVNSDSNLVYEGAGFFSGSTSMNKAGAGTLALNSNNNYSGATVIWEGTVEANKLANGGQPSSIGASSSYAFNLVMKGGALNYTGSSVSTDRNITLDETSEISVAATSATLTHNGTFTGVGGLIKSGAGDLRVKNNIGNNYEGETTISGGSLVIDLNNLSRLQNVMGTSGVVNLAGGTLEMINGQSSGYEDYEFDIVVPEGTTGGLKPYRNCYIKSKVSGSGNLNYTVPFVREYIQGDWSEFSGTLVANGTGSDSNGSQLMLDNETGLPGAQVRLVGNTKVINWATGGTMRLGGLSGNRGTYLGAASKQTDGVRMTWIVGGAGTDETFNGVINNDCSAGGHYGITSIVKEGTGIWRLSGGNVYTGSTIVRDGTLIVNGSHAGTANVTVQEGATLTGEGRLRSLVTVQSGGILEAGDFGISTFYLGSLTLNEGAQVNVEINKNTGSNDRFSTSTVRYNGTLNLQIEGELQAGDEFTLFSASNHMGEFTEIVPAIPGEGLHWKLEDGVLSVGVGTAASDIKKSDFQVYPNPVTDWASITCNQEYTNLHVKVHTLTGKSVINKILAKGDANVDMSQLSNGMYLFYAEADGVPLKSIKILKQ